MREAFYEHLQRETKAVEEAGLFKRERVITSPQRAVIDVAGGKPVINLCANNYLGLAADAEVVKAAHQALDEHGYGMASVRFICGTQDVHKELEAEIARFVGCEDTILYSSCWDANGGVFETILGEEDAVISDALNHASIIDGIRLCKAKRLRYDNNDMADLERALKEASGSRFKLIVTDGVFSMDGIIANLKAICDLADRYGALTMVDDSHAIGFVGANGRGTPEHCGVLGRIDIITGTLGKALGGASGGYTSGRKAMVTWLRQRSRPYLFSNSLAPAIAATSLAILKRLGASDGLRAKLRDNTAYFRSEMQKLGFDLGPQQTRPMSGEATVQPPPGLAELAPGEHPIIPIMLGDAKLASAMADALLNEGIYVIGFSFPVVPKDKARIRTQMSAGHDREHLERAVHAFAKVGRSLGVIR